MRADRIGVPGWRALRSALVGALFTGMILLVTTPGEYSPETSAEMLPPAAPTFAGPPLAEGDGFRPERIELPRLGIDAEVRAAGTTLAYDSFVGRVVESFGVPADMHSTTWWSEGPAPGSGGLAVILGHTQIGGGYGVFNNIGTLEPGDRIDVAGAGASAVFAVREVVSGIRKSDPENLSRVLSDHAETAGIALITCGGLFDADHQASEDNVVVIAERIGQA